MDREIGPTIGSRDRPVRGPDFGPIFRTKNPSTKSEHRQWVFTLCCRFSGPKYGPDFEAVFQSIPQQNHSVALIFFHSFIKSRTDKTSSKANHTAKSTIRVPGKQCSVAFLSRR